MPDKEPGELGIVTAGTVNGTMKQPVSFGRPW